MAPHGVPEHPRRRAVSVVATPHPAASTEGDDGAESATLGRAA
ncbi:hypothetical protein FHR81_001908 [Actinoalloteichus hoggarensis]|nr:hypothetical protein [Actinoalloteichus hoggarensis]